MDDVTRALETSGFLGLATMVTVVGFAVSALGVAGRLRTAVTGLFIAGQWLLPVTIWVGDGGGVTVLMPTTFLWGLCLVVSVLLLAWPSWTSTDGEGGIGRTATPADD